MKKIFITQLCLAVFAVAFAQTGNVWTRKADFKGGGSGIGFSIGDKGYMGIGNYGYTFYKDFWEYNPSTGTWTQKADFGGAGRFVHVGFSIGNKGYVGLGNDGTNYLKDFWEYDPSANTWTRKADFPYEKGWAQGFNIGDKGYVVAGQDPNGNDLKDFWEYDPGANTWTRKADFGGEERSFPSVFSVGNKGYAGLGIHGYSNDLKDFWEYDPASDVWTRKADFAGQARRGTGHFVIANKGYVGCGGYGDLIHLKDFWEYDPAADKWTRKADFGAKGRSTPASFSIGNKGYFGGGWDGTYYKDFWEYTPDDLNCYPPSGLAVNNVTDSSVRVQWSLPVSSVNGFLLHYHPVGSYAWREKLIPSTSTHIVLKKLLPGTTYKWRIRSACSNSLSGWVAGPAFTTTGTEIVVNAPISSEMKEYVSKDVGIIPNPNNGNFTLQMKLPAMGAATTISLYNNLGEKLWQQSLGKLGGAVNRSIELPNKLQTGIYILKIERSDIQLTQRIVINK